jgi:hypothetical protein
MATIEDAVRMLAYELWEAAGRPHGRSDEFWFLAETRVLKRGDPEASLPVKDAAPQNEAGAAVAEEQSPRAGAV